MSQAQAHGTVTDFKAADANNDGKLTQAEFSAACNKGLVIAAGSSAGSRGMTGTDTEPEEVVPSNHRKEVRRRSRRAFDLCSRVLSRPGCHVEVGRSRIWDGQRTQNACARAHDIPERRAPVRLRG